MEYWNIDEEIPTVKMNHFEYLESCFDEVNNENELRNKHEENMNVIIEMLKTNNPIENVDNEETIESLKEEFEENFQSLLIIYRSKYKDSNFENRDSSLEYKDSNLGIKKALEKAKEYYVEEMDKHFVEPKFIHIKKLQDLHEKYKSLAHDKINEEINQLPDIQSIRQQLDQILETIYKQYKKQNLTYTPGKQAIGIDLGTTYCCIGVMHRGKVQIISNDSGNNTTPSYVAFDEKGEESLIGLYAKEESYANPNNTIYDAKRMIGRKYSDEQIQNDMKLWPFDVVEVDDSLKIKLYNANKTTLYPEQVSAEILKKLKKDAEDFLGYEVENAVITVPAHFNDAQRQATKAAGLLAGLHVMQILNEPTAAAIAYTHQIKDVIRKNILIYDLGGGTFDVAIVVIDKGDIDVRAVGGDTHLGGVDFDQCLMNHFYRKYKDEFRKPSNSDVLKKALARLKIQCEKKKWILSNVDSATISIDFLLPNWDFKETIKRAHFENICKDLFKKTIRIVDETIRSANMSKSDINEIVLIGGSTKIPKIQSLLEKYFDGKPLNKRIKPDEAVAYGATIKAALLNGEKFSQLFSIIPHDVAPFSLGIELKDKSMSVIIPRNSKLSIERSQRFFTAEDKQTYVFIQIFEGENFKKAKRNRLLGSFTIDGLPKKPKGQEHIDVTFRIDEEGILHVIGQTSVKSTNLTIKDNRGRISLEELEALRSQVKKANRATLSEVLVMFK